MMLFLFLLVSELLALVGEEYIPALPYGVRVLLLPLVFFYGALALSPPGMLGLAFAAGFMWDAFIASQVVDGNLEIALGWSIVLFAALGAVMCGFRPLYQRGHGWEIHCLLSGPLLCIFILSEYLMITFRRGEFLFPKVIWWRIGGEGLVAIILAPVVFVLLHWVASSFGWLRAAEEPGPAPV